MRVGMITPSLSGHGQDNDEALPVTALATDARLLPSTAASGAKLVFEEVFRSEAASVGRALRYLGVNDAALDDACQEVFLIVHRRLHEFAGGSVRAWIRQICVNVARTQRRTVRRRREEVVDVPPEAAVDATQHGAVEERQFRAHLLRLLDTLSEEQRTVFVLFELEQIAMAEVAAAVGCPVPTAYSRLRAARAAVRERIGAKS